MNIVCGLLAIGMGLYQIVAVSVPDDAGGYWPRAFCLESYWDHRYARMIDLMLGVSLVVLGVAILFGLLGSGDSTRLSPFGRFTPW
jgi:hypothetical protein